MKKVEIVTFLTLFLTESTHEVRILIAVCVVTLAKLILFKLRKKNRGMSFFS